MIEMYADISESMLTSLKRIEKKSFSKGDSMINSLQIEIKKTGSLLFTYKENDLIVGFLIISRFKSVARINKIAVDPNYRRKGIGRTLLLSSIKYMQDRGADEIELHVSVKNDVAFNLYKSVGFEVKSTVPSYYAKGIDAYVMCTTTNLFLYRYLYPCIILNEN
jgi:ribosomal-protein-alanine N-acetyltransferase